MPVVESFETIVKVAPATVSLDATPLIVSRVGLYCSVKVPEVTFWALLMAIGMPLPGCCWER